MKVQCVIFIVGFVVLAAAKPQGQSLQQRVLDLTILLDLIPGKCPQCNSSITEILKSIDFKNLMTTVPSLGPFVENVTTLADEIAINLLTNVNASRKALKLLLDTVESSIKPVLEDVKVTLQNTIKCQILGDLMDHLGDNIKATVTAIKINFDPVVGTITVDLPSAIGQAVKSAQPEIVTFVKHLFTDTGGVLGICDLLQKLGPFEGVFVLLLIEILKTVLGGSKTDTKIIVQLRAQICPILPNLPVFITLRSFFCK